MLYFNTPSLFFTVILTVIIAETIKHLIVSFLEAVDEEISEDSIVDLFAKITVNAFKRLIVKIKNCLKI